MGQREEDGDGVGEEEGGGAGRVHEGQGEQEDRAGDVERVKVGQAQHQSVESVQFLLPNKTGRLRSEMRSEVHNMYKDLYTYKGACELWASSRILREPVSPCC